MMCSNVSTSWKKSLMRDIFLNFQIKKCAILANFICHDAIFVK